MGTLPVRRVVSVAPVMAQRELDRLLQRGYVETVIGRIRDRANGRVVDINEVVRDGKTLRYDFVFHKDIAK